jgi:hypothetical protein
MAAVSIEVACARGELQCYGFAIAQRFFNNEEAAGLQSTVLSASNIISARPGHSDTNPQKIFWFRNDVSLQQASNLLTGNNSPLLARYAEYVDLIGERTRHIFGNAWRLCPDRSCFLRNVGTTKSVAWRSNADEGIERQHYINVWLPLDAEGKTFPSLDLVPGSHQTMREMSRVGASNGHLSDAFVRAIGQHFTPELVLGDAIAIDKFTLYRPQSLNPGHTNRLACEFCFRHSPWRGVSSRLAQACASIAALAR